MSTIVKYETRIEEILNERQNRIDFLGEQIYKARQRMDELQGEMMQATASGDIQKHVDLSFQKDRVEKELKAMRLQVDLLENDEKPLISDEEYKTGLTEIMQEVDRINKSAKKEILSLIRQIGEIGERNRQVIRRADSVLGQWQEQIYKNSDRKMRLNNGRVILLASRAEVKDNSVSNFTRQLCDGHYAKMFQEQVEGGENNG